jgi:hypothetical protein
MTRNQARRLQWVRRWHRRAGLVAALWLALLAVTGSAINRAHDWGLDRAALPAMMLGALYGIDAQEMNPCAELDPVADACDDAFARFATPAGSMVVAPHRALLLGPDDQLVEALPAGQLGLTRIDAGLAAGGWIYLRDGQRIVAAAPDLLTLRDPEHAELAGLPDGDWKQPDADAAAGRITWERLLLDLHAARFLGPAARWFTDLMAALIVLLVGGGIWLYRLRGISGER